MYQKCPHKEENVEKRPPQNKKLQKAPPRPPMHREKKLFLNFPGGGGRLPLPLNMLDLRSPCVRRRPMHSAGNIKITRTQITNYKMGNEYLNYHQKNVFNSHLGNYMSTDIADRNIIDSVYDLYQRSN